ncbi:MAG: AbrB/MazE/SpoVT family DNA-binding domain-containing protein [Microgenomates group bacterium]
MPYLVSITSKGQMTLPKDIREALNIIPPARLLIDFGRKKDTFKIKPLPDIMKLGGKFKAPRNKSALKARDYLEKRYSR